jgi:hypothetical protein
LVLWTAWVPISGALHPVQNTLTSGFCRGWGCCTFCPGILMRLMETNRIKQETTGYVCFYWHVAFSAVATPLSELTQLSVPLFFVTPPRMEECITLIVLDVA